MFNLITNPYNRWQHRKAKTAYRNARALRIGLEVDRRSLKNLTEIENNLKLSSKAIQDEMDCLDVMAKYGKRLGYYE